MTTTLRTATRWKLATALLAGIAGYSLFLRGGASTNVPAAQAEVTHRSSALPKELRRPLRISAEAAGISKSDIVERFQSTHNLRDLGTLAEKLAAVGDDEAIAALEPLLANGRRGVPEVLLGAFGKIGTQKAVDVLLAHVHDDRPAVRFAAIAALGSTQSEAAEKVLLDLAGKGGDPAQTYAISALGAMGTDKGLETLAKIAGSGDFATGNAAVYALGAAATPEADAVLRKLIDSPDSRIAAAALGAIVELDGPLIDKLTQIVKSGDPQRVHAALIALGKAGEVALPALREAALRGSMNTRWAAVAAIGEVRGPKAIQLLGEILKTGDRQSAVAAANGLAVIGGTEARGLLIEVALSDRGQMSGALAQVALMEGEDVDAALLTVMRDRNTSNAERRSVLPRLVKSGNAEALQLAIDLASKGSRNERTEAMRVLAESGQPRAFDALVDLAGKARGQSRVSALEMIAQVRPGDAALGQLLTDSLFSGRRDEASYAATVLGRIGTDDARQALIPALGDKDQALAAAAAGALGQGGLTESVKSALLSAAHSNPLVKTQVMNQLLRAGAPEGIRFAEDMINAGKEGAAQAVWALANVGTTESRRLLERALDSKEPSVRMAALGTLANNPDDRSVEALLRMSKDTDASIRASALATLGQIGSEKAQAAIIAASSTGKADERIAAIAGLATMDDPRASAQLARLMRDPDPQVAQLAVSSAYNGGPEVDQTLTQIINDTGTTAEMRQAAAQSLRSRGAELDDATEKKVTELAGPPHIYGGYGYGGYESAYMNMPIE